MKISTNSRYALRFLLRLALAPKGCRTTTMYVAEQEGISEKMLERIAAKLRKEGYVISAKGVGGGYCLARPAEEIMVGEILRLMETSFIPLHCTDHPEENCKMVECCVFSEIFACVDRAIRDATDQLSLAQVRDRFLEKNQAVSPL